MSDNILIDLYKEYAGEEPRSVEKLTGSGSNRRYCRLSGPVTLIGVIGESVEENRAFISLARSFAGKGIAVPRVVAVSADSTAYLQDDLGSLSLYDFIARGRTTGVFSDGEERMMELAVRQLADIQFRGAEGLDFSVCYPLASFTRRTVMWDLNYFKYCFLKTSELSFNESRLEDDFERLADELLDGNCDTFMYRDFQSRNVMISDGRPFFIDFQGGRRGPVHYDVASFLWQAKANIPSAMRDRLIDAYLDSASRYAEIDRDGFRRKLRHFVLFRLLQVLGAYGFRGRFERKAHFLESIPAAMRRLDEILSEGFDEYPALTDILRRLVKVEAERQQPERSTLMVTVMSFSYKKGLPDDPSGNGGGFVFDCRGMHNPGRYDIYKPLTGMDRPVIDFLEERGEVQRFLKDCRSLVDESVSAYMRRGFTSLMVCFGCTGGRHRSVYCAEAMARHLNERFKIDVKLVHREQDITLLLPPRSSVNV